MNNPTMPQGEGTGDSGQGGTPTPPSGGDMGGGSNQPSTPTPSDQPAGGDTPPQA